MIVVVACYAKVIVMHTFDDVDGGVVDVDMHPPSKLKHPPSLPSLFTTLPFLVYIHPSAYIRTRRC